MNDEANELQGELLRNMGKEYIEILYIISKLFCKSDFKIKCLKKKCGQFEH